VSAMNSDEVFEGIPYGRRGGSASLGLDGFGSIGFPYACRGGSAWLIAL
jgi:hypothetical protein